MSGIEYMIVRCGGTDSNAFYVQEQVNIFASEGWIPHGGLTVTADGTVYQAMTRSIPYIQEKPR